MRQKAEGSQTRHLVARAAIKRGGSGPGGERRIVGQRVEGAGSGEEKVRPVLGKDVDLPLEEAV